MKLFSRLLIVFILLLGFQVAKSQRLLSQTELESLLNKAETQSQKYNKVFKNLSAEELKTKFYYKTSGEVDEKRIIKSLFIVYEPPGGEYSQEYFYLQKMWKASMNTRNLESLRPE